MANESHQSSTTAVSSVDAKQLRDDLINAGVAQLATCGLIPGLDQIDLADVADSIPVSPEHALQLWRDGDDDATAGDRFRVAVAGRVLEEQPGEGDGGRLGGAHTATLIAVSEILEAMPAIESITPEERGEWLRRIHRSGSNENHHLMHRSNLWRSYLAITAGLLSQPDPSPELMESWKNGDGALVDTYTSLYAILAGRFGFRLRYCYTWEQFATAAAALAEGLILRSPVNPHVDGIVRATGPDGDEENWTLFAVCFEALLRQFLEPDGGGTETALTHEGPAADDQ